MVLIIIQGISLPNAAEINEAVKIITEKKTKQLTKISSKIEAHLDPDTKRDPEISMFHKHIAQKIANRTSEKYKKVQTLVRCKLSFLILRSVLLCIRGSRSISKDSVVLDDISLTCSAAGLF